MENQQIPEEPTKEQASLSAASSVSKTTQNKTEELSGENPLTSVESAEGESIQKATEESPLKQLDNSQVSEPLKSIKTDTDKLPYESLLPSENIGIGNFIQDPLKSMQHKLQQLQIQIGLGSQQEMEENVNKVSEDLNRIVNFLYKNQHLCPVLISNQNLKVIEQNIAKAIKLLSRLRENEGFRSENYALRQENANLNIKTGDLEREVNNYRQQLQVYSLIRQEKQNLQINNDALQNDIRKLKQERDAWEKERSRMVSELANKNRNKTTTYISGEDAGPQHHLLYQEFKQLKEQEFNAVSTEIFQYFSDRHPSLKANRKQEIAKIKSILSKQVIINGMKLFTGDSKLPSEILENALRFVTALGIIEGCEIPESVSNELENLIKPEITSLNEKSSTYTAKRSWNEEEFTTAVKDISKSVNSALEMPESAEITEAIENLVRKGLELVKKIASADPPGTLWTEEEDIPYKSDRHEAILGCEESGKILLTVYPGYLVGDRVFEKPLVFTVPE